MYLKIKRRNRPDCIVMLCQDRTTKKWCFVNLSSEHVCTCRFDTIDEAPMAYKSAEEIEELIADTVEIKKRIKPIYNFKAK